MPTGYTDKIKDDITFEQYALSCARAFGALIMMRDEPSDAEIPEEFAVSDYHLKELDKARLDLIRLNNMTDEELFFAANADFYAAEKTRLENLERNQSLRVKYMLMLEKVNKWIPPTSDHAGLHEFMRDQITKSIEFDCDENYYSKPTNKLSTVEWLEKQKEKCIRDIEYYKKSYAEEVERVNIRNLWVKNLRKSLV